MIVRLTGVWVKFDQPLTFDSVSHRTFGCEMPRACDSSWKCDAPDNQHYRYFADCPTLLTAAYSHQKDRMRLVAFCMIQRRMHRERPLMACCKPARVILFSTMDSGIHGTTFSKLTVRIAERLFEEPSNLCVRRTLE